MSITTYSLTNKQRDLSGAMHTVIAGRGSFLSRFKAGARAINHKHEWLEDQIAGRGFTVTAYGAGKGTLSAADFLKVRVGTRFVVVGYPVVFRVTALDDVASKITAAVHAANGDTSKTILAAGDVCRIVSSPVKENSRAGDGEYTRRSVGTAYNYTQIIRKDLGISASALATSTIDQVENSLQRQTEFALQEAARDMNRCAIWGVRTERNEPSAVDGEAGGLYGFATSLVVDAGGTRLTSKLVNDAAEKITEEGGNPSTLYCTPAQARVLANEYKNNITVMRDDAKRGVYVAVVVNEANGQNINIVGDPDFADGDAFLADDDCFAVSDMRPIGDTDSTPPDADGISRKVIGEFTFEFHNANQRVCRIANLMDPTDALEEIEDDLRSVNISGDISATGAISATGDISATGPVTATGSMSTVAEVDADADVPAASADNKGTIILIGTGWTEGTKIVTAVAGEFWGSNGTAWVKLG